MSKDMAMNRTHSFELVGIGEFSEVPAKVQSKDYPIVNKLGEALVKKALQVGVPSEFGYMDKNGVVYEKSDVYYNLNGQLVQKVNRTDKVKAFDIVDKSEAMNLLERDTSFLIASSLTALDILKEKIGNDKALKFVYKKSSVGLKFVKAYIYQLDNQLCMITGLGDRNKALEMFKSRLTQINDKKTDVLEVSANDVQINLD